MKTSNIIWFLSFISMVCFGQQRAEISPNGIVFPQFNTANLPINSPGNPIATGTMIFNTSLGKHQFWNGTNWVDLIPSSIQKSTFYVEGRQLKDPCGNTVILKGVNKMNVWTDQDGLSIPEIAQTGANCLRIVWTTTFNGSPTNDVKLDSLISKCIQAKMIPMVEIHDATCNLGALQVALNYWKRPPILAIIEKYKHALLLNIANEPGDWQATAQQFEVAYLDAITQLRNAGITVPLVIDGIDCGKNLEIIVQKAPTLINHDPLHNLLFSVHTYWPKNNGATPAFITAQFEAATAANIPFIVGELSKYGAWAGNGVSVCTAPGEVNYQWIATECQRLGIGWLAWEWGPGNSGGGDPLCTAMDMTTNNTFASLSGWGLELANNATYGLITSQKTPYIQNKFTKCN